MENKDDPKVIYEGRFLRIICNNGWEYAERVACKRIACIAPILVDNGKKSLVLIKEFRKPLQKYVIGPPAGLVGDHDNAESLEDGALRELIEETGYSGRIRYVMHGPPSAGMSNEVLHFYVADQLKKVGDGGGDETENITVILVPLDNIASWLHEESRREDQLIDPKVCVGLYYASTMDIL